MEGDDQPIAIVEDEDLLYCFFQINPALVTVPGYERRHYLHPRYQLEPPLALCRTRTGPLYFLPMIWEEDEEDEEGPRVEFVNQVHIEEESEVVEEGESCSGQRYIVEEPLEEENDADAMVDEQSGEAAAAGNSDPGCGSQASVKLKRRKSI